MTSQILGTLFVLLALYLFNILYIVPKRTMKGYVNYLRSKGYRVKEIPYALFYGYFDLILQNPKKEGDAFKYIKQEFPKYDFIVTNVLNTPYIQVCHPDFIKEYYQINKHYQYPKVKTFLSGISRITGYGLPFSEGQEWKRKRTVLNSVFNFEFVKSKAEGIAEICDKSMKNIQQKSKVIVDENGQKSVEFNVLDLTIQQFSQVTMNYFLGLKSQQMIQGVPVANYLKKLVDDGAQSAYDWLSLMLGQKFMKLGLRAKDRDIIRRSKAFKQWATAYLKQKIQKTETNLKNNVEKTGQPSDIIQALFINKHKNKQAESMTSLQQIFAEFSAFFYAGTDTTSNYTEMMIYSIAKNPEVEKKLREQIAAHMPNENYSYENLKNFKYIDNIQKQTTRMYGPAAFLFIRQASVDNILGGLPVKKGTCVSIMNFGHHYSQKYFKQPLKFRPERWESECDNIPPFVVGGFSAGARTCIGKHLALLENKISLIKFMQRYKKITLGIKDFKLGYKLLPCAQYFKTKLVINDQEIIKNQ